MTEHLVLEEEEVEGSGVVDVVEAEREAVEAVNSSSSASREVRSCFLDAARSRASFVVKRRSERRTP